jgi:hypothetical protein
MFNPLWTAKVWFPKYVPSLITSLNQKDIERISKTRDDIKKYPALEKPCIDNDAVVVSDNNAILVYKGQKEGDTK